jgi:hypothetical protein
MRDFLAGDDAAFAHVLADPGPAGSSARAVLAPRIEAQRPHFDFQGQALGFRYPGPLSAAATVVPDVVTYIPSADVGARGPHAWLDDSRGRVSTCDLTRSGFALLTLAAGAAQWAPAAGRVRSAARVPIEVFPVAAAGSLPGPWQDCTGAVAELYGLRGMAAVLLRPDGHVQARLDGAAAHDELERAVRDVTAVTPMIAGRRRP